MRAAAIIKQIKIMGKAEMIAADCSAVKPPTKSRTAATRPSETPQKIFKEFGGFCTPFAVIMAQTKVEESAEVIKKMQIRMTATKDVSLARGNCSSRAKRA